MRSASRSLAVRTTTARPSWSARCGRADCGRWSSSAVTRDRKAGFARSSVASVRGDTRRRTCGAPCCPARRRRSTGRTSASSPWDARSGTLWAFVMVLAYSRMRFLRFGLRAAMPSFLRGHVESFRFFTAAPRVVLYDNLKSAVLEREGDAVRFHPTLLELAGHYRFEPRACAPYRPNEKGRVERAIWQDVRDNFFAAS